MQSLKMESLIETTKSDSIYRRITSLCPFCLKSIDAKIFKKAMQSYFRSNVQKHGAFKDVLWSDASLYRRFMRYQFDGKGIENPLSSKGNCPESCGLCENHKTTTILGNIDITARCNLSCPTCFADAGKGPEDPSLDQIIAMMKILREQRPVLCPAIQFSGGEPTVRDDLPQIVGLAKRMGFAQIQIATNGLKLAKSIEMCQNLVQNGLSTAYLQFDGVTPEPYKVLRGCQLLSIKLQAIENLRATGNTSIVLVPTMAKGVNDAQAGSIIRFASKNVDVVKGISFQPVSFTGRIDQGKRVKKRLTISDLILLIEQQTNGEITREDFYPVPFIAPISGLIAAETGMPQPAMTVHPCCGAATYIFSNNGHMMPITRFVDVEGLMEKIKEEVLRFDGSFLGKLRMKGMIIKELPKFVDEMRIPDGIELTSLLLNVFKNGTREALIEFHNRSLFIGAMFFQDLYNIDLDRVQRCGIHYALPDGRIIPFCSYNTIHRARLKT